MPNKAKSNSEIMNIIREELVKSVASLTDITNNIPFQDILKNVPITAVVKSLQARLGDKCPNPKVLIILTGFMMVEFGREDYDLDALNHDIERAGSDRLYPRSLTEYLLMFSFTRKGDKPVYTWEMYQNMLYAFNVTEEYWYVISETENTSTNIADIQSFVDNYPVSGDGRSKTVILSNILNSLPYINTENNQEAFLKRIQDALFVNIVRNASLFTDLRRRTQWNFLKTVLLICEECDKHSWHYTDLENDDEEGWIFVDKNKEYSERKISVAWLANELQCFYDGTVEPGRRKSPFYRGTVNSGDSRANEDMLRNFIRGKADFGRKFMIEWIIFINFLLMDLDEDKCYTLSQLNEILDSCGWIPVTKTEGTKDFDTFISTKLFYDTHDENSGRFKIDEFGINSESDYEIGNLAMQFLENDNIIYQLPEDSEEIEKMQKKVDSLFANFFGNDSTVRRSYILKNRFLVSGKYFEEEKPEQAQKQKVIK